MEQTFDTVLSTYQQAVERRLAASFTDETQPQRQLFEAMRYSLLAGGKRIRPVLVLEFCRLCGGTWEHALDFAAAIEMVHTYSLIHDDLPCMDNDDYRRGRLTNHKVYGEAQAVLAGDGLLTAAFSTIARADAPAEVRIEIVRTLAECAGEEGMVGGQVLDMAGEGKTLTGEELLAIHSRKTGALIVAACTMGVLAAQGSEAQLRAATDFANALGLAFQIRDDMLDVLGDAKKLGKAVHADEKKNTFVSLYGLSQCEAYLQAENAKALAALDAFADTAFLRELTMRLASRDF